MRRAAVLLLAVFAAACSLDRPGATSGSPSGAEETVEATLGVAAGDERRGGSAGVPFVANPEASGGPSHEADAILAVRYGVHEGYERVVLDLGTGDEPAEVVPEWTLMSLKGDGLLRVTLPSVSATGVSDGRFGDDLLKSFYVVRAPGGRHVRGRSRPEGFHIPGAGALRPCPAGHRLQAFGQVTRSAATEGWRQHGARRAARGHSDWGPPHRQWLLP